MQRTRAPFRYLYRTQAKAMRQICRSALTLRAPPWRGAVDTLVNLQAEYAAWLDNLPPSFGQSATAEASCAIVGIGLSDLAAIAPSRGYGQD
jgi:hypothetical protein